MRFELPECKRCCICVPLRYGILIFGYLNVFFSAFLIYMHISWTINSPNMRFSILYRGVAMDIRLWLSYTLYTLDVLFNIVLLIGTHRKNVRLMNVYYYYGITTTAATIVTFVVIRPMSRYQGIYYNPLMACFLLSGLVLQCYLLLLIRSELKKIQFHGGQLRYMNNVAEIVVEPLPPVGGGNPV